MKFIIFREVIMNESTEVEFENEEELEKAWNEYENGKQSEFPPEEKCCVWVGVDGYNEQISYRKEDDVSDLVVLQDFE